MVTTDSFQIIGMCSVDSTPFELFFDGIIFQNKNIKKRIMYPTSYFMYSHFIHSLLSCISFIHYYPAFHSFTTIVYNITTLTCTCKKFFVAMYDFIL